MWCSGGGVTSSAGGWAWPPQCSSNTTRRPTGPAGQTQSRWCRSAIREWQGPYWPLWKRILRRNRFKPSRCAHVPFKVLDLRAHHGPSWLRARLLEVLWREDPCQPRLGWQQQASNALERHHHDHAVWPRLREHERAMMRSQRGPLASTPFVSFPSDRISRFDPAPFSGTPPSADFVCPSPCLFAVAGVAVHLTPLATTVQHAQQQVC